MGRDADLQDRICSLGRIHPVRPYKGLYDVISDKQFDIAREFIAAGHDSRAEFQGGTVVDLAVRYGDLDFIKFIAGNGKAINEGRQSVLEKSINRIIEAADEAEKKASLSILQYLLTLPVSGNQKAWAFRQCARSYQLEAARLLLEAGVDPQEPIQYDYRKSRPLVEDIEVQSPLFLPLLKGGDVDEDGIASEANKLAEMRPDMAINELLETMFGEEQEHAEILEGEAHSRERKRFADEIRHGDWDKYISQNHKPAILSFAAQHGFTDIAAAVLSRNPDEQTCIDAAEQAAIYGQLDVLKQIKEYGTDIVNFEPMTTTPLSYACEFGQAHIVEYLLELGANARATDTNRTSLFELTGGLKKRQVQKLLQEYSKNAEPEWKSGYAVKGKVKDWHNRQMEAVGECMNGWGTYSQLWIKAEFNDVVSYFEAVIPENILLDVRKKALPDENGLFIYQFADDEFTQVLPVYASAPGSLQQQVNLMKEQVPFISTALDTEVVGYIADDTSGTGISICQSGACVVEMHDLDEGGEEVQCEDELIKRDLLLIPSHLETNGFERRITFLNTRKSQVKKSVAIII